MTVEHPARTLEVKIIPITDCPCQLLNSEVPLRHKGRSADVREGVMILPIFKQLRIGTTSGLPRRDRGTGSV